MRTINPLITRSVATALVAGAAMAPAAAAQHQDLRMPDTRDAATRPHSRQDLVPPDTRDRAEGRDPASLVYVEVPQASSGGFQWDDAGLGALAGFGILLAGTGGAIATVRMRRRTAGV
jgi:hypothetical protein